MRQAVITAPDRFDVVETPVPRLQGDGEVLVRTAACGICSGDLMPWYLEKKIGTVLGHEVATFGPVIWCSSIIMLRVSTARSAAAARSYIAPLGGPAVSIRAAWRSGFACRRRMCAATRSR